MTWIGSAKGSRYRHSLCTRDDGNEPLSLPDTGVKAMGVPESSSENSGECEPPPRKKA